MSHHELSPTPDEVRQAREAVGMTMRDAAALIGRHHNRWTEYEGGVYPMPPPLWELFLVKTNQHPQYMPRPSSDEAV